jgi:hypothetical protein
MHNAYISDRCLKLDRSICSRAVRTRLGKASCMQQPAAKLARTRHQLTHRHRLIVQPTQLLQRATTPSPLTNHTRMHRRTHPLVAQLVV